MADEQINRWPFDYSAVSAATLPRGMTLSIPAQATLNVPHSVGGE